MIDVICAYWKVAYKRFADETTLLVNQRQLFRTGAKEATYELQGLASNKVTVRYCTPKLCVNRSDTSLELLLPHMHIIVDSAHDRVSNHTHTNANV